jgi:hypothetical protein
MSSFIDEPMIYRSRFNQSVVPPDHRGSLLSRCIDIPEFPPSLFYGGVEIIASTFVKEYEPEQTMILKLDSRRDVPVCVKKACRPMYRIGDKWVVHLKTFDQLVKEMRAKK